jgi:hypothetical protein
MAACEVTSTAASRVDTLSSVAAGQSSLLREDRAFYSAFGMARGTGPCPLGRNALELLDSFVVERLTPLPAARLGDGLRHACERRMLRALPFVVAMADAVSVREVLIGKRAAAEA